MQGWLNAAINHSSHAAGLSTLFVGIATHCLPAAGAACPCAACPRCTSSQPATSPSSAKVQTTSQSPRHFRISQVGDYAFTTLAPQLGVVPAPNPIDDPIVIADIPGLIEGAHEVRSFAACARWDSTPVQHTAGHHGWQWQCSHTAPAAAAAAGAPLSWLASLPTRPRSGWNRLESVPSKHCAPPPTTACFDAPRRTEAWATTSCGTSSAPRPSPLCWTAHRAAKVGLRGAGGG